MPKRILRDGIISSERVNRLDSASEVFYRRLMSVVDDHGLFDGRISILRASCYPLRLDSVTETDVSTWLDACVEADLVNLYQAGGKPFVQMLDFRQRTRSKPKYPPPDDYTLPPSGGDVLTTDSNPRQSAAEKNRAVPVPSPDTPTPTTPDTTPAPDTESSPGRKHVRTDPPPAGESVEVEVPSLDECRAYAESPNCGFPPGRVEEWYDDQTAQHWRYARDWRARMRADRNKAYWLKKRAEPAADGSTAKREAWKIEKDIEIVREQMNALLAPARYGYMHGLDKMREMAKAGDAKAADDVATWERLKSRKAELETEIRNA